MEDIAKCHEGDCSMHHEVNIYLKKKKKKFSLIVILGSCDSKTCGLDERSSFRFVKRSSFISGQGAVLPSFPRNFRYDH